MPQDDGAEAPDLNVLNYVNVASYVANAVIIHALNSGKVPGTLTNRQQSQKFQHLLTPAGPTFAIWGVIYVWQLVFTVAQMFPAYRASGVVQSGVGWWWAAACAAQCLWAFCFAFDCVRLSLAAMCGICAALHLLLGHCAAPGGRPANAAEQWLVVAPFSIHAGWIVAATIVNYNVVLVRVGAPAYRLLAAAAAGLAAAAVMVALSPAYAPDALFPLALAWACRGVRAELPAAAADAKDHVRKVVERHGMPAVHAVRCVCRALCLSALAAAAVVTLRPFLGLDGPAAHFCGALGTAIVAAVAVAVDPAPAGTTGTAPDAYGTMSGM